MSARRKPVSCASKLRHARATLRRVERWLELSRGGEAKQYARSEALARELAGVRAELAHHARRESELQDARSALRGAWSDLECAERRAGAYAAQATLAQAQLNRVPGWVLYLVGAWRDLRAAWARGTP